MNSQPWLEEFPEPERYELHEEPGFVFDVNRRQFVQVLGAGLLFTIASAVSSQERRGFGGGGGASASIADRLHIGTDGVITVLTGKVEVGQGSRTEITQAAAEELRVSPDRINLIMADTTLCPNDGGTAGSQTTPSTIPAIRKACATARGMLIAAAAKKWSVEASELVAEKGSVVNAKSKQSLSYAELAGGDASAEVFKGEAPSEVEITPVDKLEVLGKPLGKPNARDVVTGAQNYPSDMRAPGVMFGAILRPPSYGATLKSVDLAPAQAMAGVTAVHDGDFVGCAAPTLAQAEAAVQAIAEKATWETKPHPSSRELFKYLKDHATEGGGGGGRRGGGGGGRESGSVEEALGAAAKKLKATYEISYIQHAPMEPRAALAEWKDDSLTVWTGSQMPTRVKSDLARVFHLDQQKVRVIIPDTGGGFGGKHTGEAAIEAARLAKAAGKPVSLRWWREDEFTWAYFRPAGVIEAEAGLDAAGAITAWDFTNYNSGASAVATPYAIANNRSGFKTCQAPLAQGSYRALASTANIFARESLMDELAHSANVDPLEFRIRHLKDERLLAVLKTAAEKAGWAGRKKSGENRGFGIACGTEKGSYAAACVEVEVDRKEGRVKVLKVTEAYECGKIMNPMNLRKQVEGAIVMGLGGALSEAIEFENGKITNASFKEYHVPRFKDVPEIEVHLLDRPDLRSVGAGETPIVAVAPAIGNAIFDAIGVRVRVMPMRGKALRA